MNDIASGIRKAKMASIGLASLDTATKDAALEAMASALASRRDEVLTANRKDIESNPDVQGALLKRLKRPQTQHSGRQSEAPADTAACQTA